MMITLLDFAPKPPDYILEALSDKYYVDDKKVLRYRRDGKKVVEDTIPIIGPMREAWRYGYNRDRVVRWLDDYYNRNVTPPYSDIFL